MECDSNLLLQKTERIIDENKHLIIELMNTQTYIFEKLRIPINNSDLNKIIMKIYETIVHCEIIISEKWLKSVELIFFKIKNSQEVWNLQNTENNSKSLIEINAISDECKKIKKSVETENTVKISFDSRRNSNNRYRENKLTNNTLAKKYNNNNNINIFDVIKNGNINKTPVKVSTTDKNVSIINDQKVIGIKLNQNIQKKFNNKVPTKHQVNSLFK